MWQQVNKEINMRQLLIILTLSTGLLALPMTAQAERDKVASFYHFNDHRHQFDLVHHERKIYRDKKHRENSARQHKRSRDPRTRMTAYHHFSGNNYHHWRNRRDYGHRYYDDSHKRYRTHYLRYHRGQKNSHHQHNDDYLEWVATMLLLNEILDDDYR